MFTGRRLDILNSGSLKIYYYRARYYDPTTGRFIQRDPVGYTDGMNLYEYVNSKPIILTDPNGESIWEVILEALKWVKTLCFAEKCGDALDEMNTTKPVQPNPDDYDKYSDYVHAYIKYNNKYWEWYDEQFPKVEKACREGFKVVY